MKTKIVVLLALLSVLNSSFAQSTWNLITDAAPWIGRCRHTAVVLDNRIWIAGGTSPDRRSDVWSSNDGGSWSLATNTPGWAPKANHAMVSFSGKLWVLGGNEIGSRRTNDVWSSSNGANWVREVGSAQWGARCSHTAVVYKNKIWIMGGVWADNNPCYNDVWYSEDGRNWACATSSAQWGARENHCSVVFDDKIWIIGGIGPGTNYPVLKDVWYSSDGISWICATNSAPWGPRCNMTVVAFDGEMWLMGGNNKVSLKNDVWRSKDGINWALADGTIPWNAREEHAAVINNNAIFLIGGASSVYCKDVWKYSIVQNNDPQVNAGNNISVNSDQIRATIISGTAIDSDVTDLLQYRWRTTEGILHEWKIVGLDGTCILDLNTIQTSIGQTTLTLEVTDGKATVTDDMILTIANSAPTVSIRCGYGIFELSAPVTLSAEVSDYDADLVSYEWIENNSSICVGNIQSNVGGEPVQLPFCVINSLSLGEHIITLKVWDYANEPIVKNILLTVVDNDAPTLAPVINKAILWPPNHEMIDISIQTNVQDNSNSFTISAIVASNELIEGLGDGDLSPDWTEPVIDNSTGNITFQLRAERSGTGNGRIYKVSITATDESANSSVAEVDVIVPHNRGKSK